ncbi:MAG: glycosyltransferase family 2 protein [Bacilli bacterium]
MENENTNQFKLVSIIIPTFNRASLLERAINSVLTQSYKNVEIIVSDDNSNENIEEVVKNINSPLVKYFKNIVNLGVCKNKFEGFQKSKGDYVVFLDNDDYFNSNDYISSAVDKFMKYNNISVFACSSEKRRSFTNEVSNEHLGYEGIVSNKEYLANLFVKYDKPSQLAMIISRNSILKSKIMDTGVIDDFILFLSALSNGDAYVTNQVMVVYEIQKKSTTNSFNNQFIRQTSNAIVLTTSELVERKIITSKIQNEIVTYFFSFLTTGENFGINDIIFIRKILKCNLVKERKLILFQCLKNYFYLKIKNKYD